jgi:3D (Asp-Asp-Asp) domain-containing protein
MRSSAGSGIFVIACLLLSSVPISGQSCGCQPSPPGGYTACESGQIAVCGISEGGGCAGRCVGPTEASATRSTGEPYPGSVINVIERPSETYSATAYSLRGRTASGQYVTRGLIAADPRYLPLGTRVRLDAGPWSGEYLVADTGGAIKGRRIDIWTPSNREAEIFSRRDVKLTVLSLPRRTGKNL